MAENKEYICNEEVSDMLQEMTSGEFTLQGELEHELSNISYSEEDVLKLFREVCQNMEITLSELGIQKTKEWLTSFKVHGCQSEIVKEYPHYCCKACTLFEGKIENPEAAKVLIDLMEKITEPAVTTSQLQSYKITSWENDITEYLGGFVLKKALMKFKQYSGVIKLFSADSPQGQLIGCLEKETAELKYPSENLTYCLQHIYIEFSKLISVNLDSIEFSKLSDRILAGPYFYTLLRHFENHIEDLDLVEEVVAEVINYITKLFISTLSYSFAKKTFQKLFHFSYYYFSSLSQTNEESGTTFYQKPVVHICKSNGNGNRNLYNRRIPIGRM